MSRDFRMGNYDKWKSTEPDVQEPRRHAWFYDEDFDDWLCRNCGRAASERNVPEWCIIAANDNEKPPG